MPADVVALVHTPAMGNWIPVVAAVAGGAIAATASYLTGRVDARRQREIRAEDRADAARKEALTLRRTTYAEFYAAMRYHYNALRDYAALLSLGSEDMDTARDHLEKARKESVDAYFSAQMILPDSILLSARAANTRLNGAYKLLTRTADPDPDEANEYLEKKTGPALWSLRDHLRKDLGIALGGSELQAAG